MSSLGGLVRTVYNVINICDVLNIPTVKTKHSEVRYITQVQIMANGRLEFTPGTPAPHLPSQALLPSCRGEIHYTLLFGDIRTKSWKILRNIFLAFIPIFSLKITIVVEYFRIYHNQNITWPAKNWKYSTCLLTEE